MAKPTSFSKRENEKKKASKRLEKQKKKEERKSNPGSGSFEDMIMYVDANGMLTSTPPEEQEVAEEVELDEIQISIPKKEETEPEVNTGRVNYFNAKKGYGFIEDAATKEKYFFHISSAPDSIKEGDRVTFDKEKSPRGMNAVRVAILS